MNYLVKEFDFLIDKKFFPGYDVIKPFYITVEYEFYYQTKEVRVINLKFSVKAFPAIRRLSGFADHVIWSYMNQKRISHVSCFNNPEKESWPEPESPAPVSFLGVNQSKGIKDDHQKNGQIFYKNINPHLLKSK